MSASMLQFVSMPPKRTITPPEISAVSSLTVSLPGVPFAERSSFAALQTDLPTSALSRAFKDYLLHAAGSCLGRHTRKKLRVFITRHIDYLFACCVKRGRYHLLLYGKDALFCLHLRNAAAAAEDILAPSALPACMSFSYSESAALKLSARFFGLLDAASIIFFCLRVAVGPDMCDYFFSAFHGKALPLRFIS